MLSKFAPGQVWTYKTRPHENDSRVIIVGVDDDHEYGPIIHIYVSNLAIESSSAPDGAIKFIGHMPFAEEALADSVAELEMEATQLPDYEEGYRLWREAFEKSEAGVFTTSVADGIDFIAKTVAQ